MSQDLGVGVDADSDTRTESLVRWAVEIETERLSVLGSCKTLTQKVATQGVGAFEALRPTGCQCCDRQQKEECRGIFCYLSPRILSFLFFLF